MLRLLRANRCCPPLHDNLRGDFPVLDGPCRRCLVSPNIRSFVRSLPSCVTANTARSRCGWSVSGGRACGTVCVYHEPVDGASERLAGDSDCSAARFSAAVAGQNVLQPVVWQQAHGHAQLAAGVIETELAAGEGVLGLARANRPRRHVAARRGVTNMMLLQHSFIWWLSQWDGAAALPS